MDRLLLIQKSASGTTVAVLKPNFLRGCQVECMDGDTEYRTEKRRSTWPKVVDLLLRSSHIGTSSVLFGGIVWAVPYARFSTWHHLAIATGIFLIILNVWRSRHWPYQGRGVMAWLHIGLVGLVHVLPTEALPMLVTALAVGVVGSHMPGSLRHWSLVHRRRID